MIVSFHVTHRSAGADCLNEIIPDLGKHVRKFLEGCGIVDEYVVLQTCNRFEVYVATKDNVTMAHSFREFRKGVVPFVTDERVSFVLEDMESIRHLFRVCCGLDSLIVGEDQIQGQVREAYMESKKAGTVGPMLTRMFDSALSVGKRVRTETSLNEGAVSVGSAAVELAERTLETLDGKTVTVMGAGETATTIAKSLAGRPLNAIFVSNRTYNRAVELAEQIGGKAIGTQHRLQAIGRSDVLLVATSAPHILLHKSDIAEAMEGKTQKLLIIDVSVPRNVAEDVGEVDNVELATMDGLQAIAMENAAKRRAQVSDAEIIVREELIKIDRRHKEEFANNVIAVIGSDLAGIRKAELERAKARIAGGDSAEDVLDDFSKALISKIMNGPYGVMREASRNGKVGVCEAAADLFGVKE